MTCILCPGCAPVAGSGWMARRAQNSPRLRKLHEPANCTPTVTWGLQARKLPLLMQYCVRPSWSGQHHGGRTPVKGSVRAGGPLYPDRLTPLAKCCPFARLGASRRPRQEGTATLSRSPSKQNKTRGATGGRLTISTVATSPSPFGASRTSPAWSDGVDNLLT